VSFQRAKPVDALYDEVADHDLVIVPDAPLASALNRRLDHPHLGTFATTPRRLAAGRRETAEDRLAFLELVEYTDLDWKASAYAIGNILQCWEHQGTLHSILDYPTYATETTRKAVEHIDTLATTSRALTDYQIPDGDNVAVIGEPQFTTLEQSILPRDYDTISPFTDDRFDHPQFQIFDSATAIVDTVVDAISQETADQVAVVLNQQTEYSTLIEAALDAADIPFYGGPGFNDDPRHRAFLQFLRTTHRGSDTRIKDVTPLLETLGTPPDIDHAEKRLHERPTAAVDWLADYCDRINEETFGSALSAFEQQADCELTAFRAELDALGLTETTVTAAAVDRLAFYLQAYEVPVDRENEGVLLADATAAAYVDRPLVFHLGLSEDWTQTPPQRPWVDEDAQYTRNIHDFQLLLQSGADQYYLVTDTDGGAPVTPCLYFEELLATDYERFSDLPSTTHTHHGRTNDPGFTHQPQDTASEEVAALSQSSLSTYVNSPRDYLFGRLLDSPDKDYFREGNLFHDFAEFYVNHPDFVDDTVIEEVAEHMVGEVSPLLRGVDAATRHTQYRVGLNTIVEYLAQATPNSDAFLTPSSGWGDNEFATYYDRPVDSPLTERWFENPELGLKGKIDLVGGPRTLIDHKKGSRSSASQIVGDAALDPPSDTPDFQALLYLTHWRTQNPDTELEFTFFHFLETVDDVIAGDHDLGECLTTVTYYPHSFVEHARSEAMFQELREEGANNCQKTLSKTDYKTYASVFDTHDFPATRDKEAVLASSFGEALHDRLRDAVGDYKYVERGCRQLLRHLNRVHRQNFFREDLDAFESFIETRLAELNARRAGEERFPIEGLGGEPNYRYVNHRDLLVEGTDD
jgi:hypothetical protein